MVALPTLRQLRYLEALRLHGHFGRAAEHCHVTQSTLSAGLAELEELLGARLVERTKRRVLFTPLGNEVARRGNELLLQAEQLVELVKAAREPLSGPLRLGVIPTVAPFLLPRLVLPGKQAFPNLQLILQEVQTAGLVEQVLNGRLDCGLLALPYSTSGLEVADLGEDPFLVTFRADHPLAGRERITTQDLDPDQLLLLEDGHCLRDHVLAACRLPGGRRDEIRGTSLHTVVQMVASGIGVTLLPQMAVSQGLAEGLGLVARPLADAAGGRRIALVWRASSPRGLEYRRLAGFIADVAMKPQR